MWNHTITKKKSTLVQNVTNNSFINAALNTIWQHTKLISNFTSAKKIIVIKHFLYCLNLSSIRKHMLSRKWDSVSFVKSNSNWKKNWNNICEHIHPGFTNYSGVIIVTWVLKITKREKNDSGISLPSENYAPHRGKNTRSQPLLNRSENTKNQFLRYLPSENAKHKKKQDFPRIY